MLSQSAHRLARAAANDAPNAAHGRSDLIPRSSQDGQQVFLERFQQSTHGRRVALKLAPPAADRVFVELMQGCHELSHRILYVASLAQRDLGARQRAPDVVFPLSVRQARGEFIDQPTQRFECAFIGWGHEALLRRRVILE
jgi:hypothetical protein